MSSLGRPAAAVRMMTPPVKPCCSRNSRTMPRSRLRSSRESIFARHADVIDGRHEHQEPAGHGRVRRQPRALRPERLLGHLDDDLLPFLQQLFDFRLGLFFASPLRSRGPRRPRSPSAAAATAPLRLAARVLVGFETVELLERGDDVRDVEEAVAFEAEVNERRLHAGEHFRHPALVEIADHAARSLALDEDLRQPDRPRGSRPVFRGRSRR